MLSIKKSSVIFFTILIFSLALVWFAGEINVPGEAAGESLNAYSIWPETTNV